MAPGPSARWYRPRPRARGRSGSAAATAAVAGGDAPPTSAGAGGCAGAAVAAAVRGRSSWGSRRGRCPCPEGTWRADPWWRGLAGIGGGCGIEGELADRIGKMIWEGNLGVWRLDQEQIRTPQGGFVGGGGEEGESRRIVEARATVG